MQLVGAVARAGLSDVHTNNVMCGTAVTRHQALSSDWIEFTCDPPRMARHVSIDITGTTSLTLCEVTVSTCDDTPAGKVTAVIFVKHYKRNNELNWKCILWDWNNHLKEHDFQLFKISHRWNVANDTLLYHRLSLNTRKQGRIQDILQGDGSGPSDVRLLRKNAKFHFLP